MALKGIKEGGKHEYFMFPFWQTYLLGSHMEVLSFKPSTICHQKVKNIHYKSHTMIYVAFLFRIHIRTMACFSINLYVTAELMIMRGFEIWTHVINN